MKSKLIEKEKLSQTYELDCMIYEESLTRYYCLQMMELEYNQLKISLQQQQQQAQLNSNNSDDDNNNDNEDDNENVTTILTNNHSDEDATSVSILLPTNNSNRNDTNECVLVNTNSEKLETLNNGDIVAQAILKLTEKLPQNAINRVLSGENGANNEINEANEDQLCKRIKIENNVLNVDENKIKTPPIILHLHNTLTNNSINANNISNTSITNTDINNNDNNNKIKNTNKRLKLEENKTKETGGHAN